MVLFWDRILGWARESFIPWLQRYLPSLVGIAGKAFASIHKAVAATRQAVRQAWDQLRERLVRHLIEFSRATNNEWIAKTTVWFVSRLDRKQKHDIQELVTERRLKVDELPPAVIRQWTTRRSNTVSYDFTKARDQELMEMQMEDG